MSYEYYDGRVINNVKYELSRGRIDNAENLINSYVVKYPNDALGMAYKAKILCMKGEKEKAIDLIEDNSTDTFHTKNMESKFYTIYGDILERCGEYKKAIDKYSYASLLVGDSYVPLVNKIANAYSQLKNYDKALEVLNTSKGKHDYSISITKANVLYFRGDYDKAITILNDIDDKNITSTYFKQLKYRLLGLCYINLSDLDNAEDALKKGMINPVTSTYIASESALIKVLNRKHKYDEALKLIKNYLKHGGDEIGGLYHLCEILIKKGKYNKALEEIQKISNEGLKTYELANLSLSLGDIEKAEKYFCKSASLPDNPEFYNCLKGLALCYFRKGEYDNLEYFMKNADKPKDNGTNALVYYHLKVFLTKLKNKPIDESNFIYSSRQIYNYDENLAIDHVKRHHLKELQFKSKFKEGTDIDGLFKQIKEVIKDKKPYIDQFFDRYILPYDDIGFDFNGETINQLVVITNPGTDEIITMYPNGGTENSLNEEIRKPKVIKKVSAVDKFRKRYGDKY